MWAVRAARAARVPALAVECLAWPFADGFLWVVVAFLEDWLAEPPVDWLATGVTARSTASAHLSQRDNIGEVTTLILSL
jgi:hypothetical protein